MSPRFTLNTEALLSNTAITVTFISFIAFLVEGGAGLAKLCSAADWRGMIELAVGRSLVGFLLFSGLVYQFTRRGYLKRFSRHRVAGRSEVERVYLADAPHVAILVPSYKEEPSVVRRTLLAAALQQSPNRRVILLIDDPPRPRDAEDAANLARTRRLPGEIGALLAAPSRRFEQALVDFERRRTAGPVEPAQEAERLAALMREAADWLDALADDTQANDHTDVLFIERILRGPARSHRQRAQALTAVPPRASIDLRREYRRLATLFKADLTTFERKRYANLSHEPNKAMNLNSYLGLMGRQFREVASPAGLVLEEANGRPATRSVPNADFILVLDADSLIVPE